MIQPGDYFTNPFERDDISLDELIAFVTLHLSRLCQDLIVE